jgi:putative oxidoreductase
VHWPESYTSLGQLWEGYAISNKGAGNFKLPLLFIVLLLPLIFSGAGKFSLDHVLTKFLKGDSSHPIQSDFIAKGLGLIVIGLPLFFVMTAVGIGLMAIGLLLIIMDRFITPTG